MSIMYQAFNLERFQRHRFGFLVWANGSSSLTIPPPSDDETQAHTRRRQPVHGGTGLHSRNPQILSSTHAAADVLEMAFQYREWFSEYLLVV